MVVGEHFSWCSVNCLGYRNAVENVVIGRDMLPPLAPALL